LLVSNCFFPSFLGYLFKQLEEEYFMTMKMDEAFTNDFPTKELPYDLKQRIQTGGEIIYQKKQSRLKELRPGFIILFAVVVIGAGIGLLFDFLISFFLADAFINVGIGAAIGLSLGILVGLMGLIITKNTEKGLSLTGSLRDISINASIGLVVSLFLSVGLGAFYGFVIELLNVQIIAGTDNLFMGLVMVAVFSVNIGIVTGIIISLGIFKGLGSGSIAGLLVGSIGMFAVFGISWSFTLGVLICTILGSFVGSILNYSVQSQVGSDVEMMLARKEQEKTIGKKEKEYYYDRGYSPGWTYYLCGPSYYYDSVCCSGEAFFFIVAALIIIFPIVLLSLLLNFFAANTGKSLNKNIKGQGVPLLLASIFISTAIGANIGLTASFRTLHLGTTTGISSGVAFAFSILLFLSVLLSHYTSFFLIAPKKIAWRDGHTKGSVHYSQIKTLDFDYSFEETKNKEKKDEESFLIIYQRNGRIKKIRLGIWQETKDSIDPEYIPEIISHYKQVIEASTDLTTDYSKEMPSEEKVTVEERIDTMYPKNGQKGLGYSREDILRVKSFIDKQPNATVVWLSTVTKIPYGQIIEIITQYLDMRVHDGVVYARKKYEEKFGQDEW
jgi:hypothetical protein